MINSTITKLFFTITLTFLLNVAVSQKREMLSEGEAYTIEQKHIVCKSSQGYDYDYIVINYSNLTDQEIEIKFDMEVWYQDGCSTCNSPDLKTKPSIVVPAYSNVEGDCKSSKLLRVFDHSITVHPNAYKGVLDKIVYKNVEVLNN